MIYNSFLPLELLRAGLTINAVRMLTYFVDCLPIYAKRTNTILSLQLSENNAENKGIKAFKRAAAELQKAGYIELIKTPLLANCYYNPLSNLGELLTIALKEKKQYRQNLKPDEKHKLGLPIFRRLSFKENSLKSLYYNENQRLKLGIPQVQYIVFLAVYSYSKIVWGTFLNNIIYKFPENTAKQLAARLGVSLRTVKSVNALIKQRYNYDFLESFNNGNYNFIGLDAFIKDVYLCSGKPLSEINDYKDAIETRYNSQNYELINAQNKADAETLLSEFGAWHYVDNGYQNCLEEYDTDEILAYKITRKIKEVFNPVFLDEENENVEFSWICWAFFVECDKIAVSKGLGKSLYNLGFIYANIDYFYMYFEGYNFDFLKE